jgi:hypothetical protein
MSRMLRVCVLPFLFSMSAAWADDRDKEPFVMMGLARSSCGAFLDAMEGERRARPPDANPDGIYSQKYGGYLDLLTVS